VGRTTSVYLETGSRWVFASAVDWPGWARRGRGEDEALIALADYRDRYAAAIGRRPDELADDLDVVGRVPGGAMPDFGAIGAIGDWDRSAVTTHEGKQLAGLLAAIWASFDAAVSVSSETLVKGPRGGGRDRDPIVEHVREAERSYLRKTGLRLAPRTPWAEQRAAFLEMTRAGATDETTQWPLRYLVRRVAWHVLDHAWEIQDKQPGDSG
jgi:hypothetical protein